MYKMPTG
ncbi:uncharacterized protein FFC1_15163 [Fusarium fujikuroi]|nr:uncharacterized protein FFC1_15163 [Fusarium fujikuroi]